MRNTIKHELEFSAGQNWATQSRLLFVAALFMILYAAALTIAPAVRSHSWATPLRWNHWAAVGVWIVAMLVILIPNRSTNLWTNPFFLPLTALLSGLGILTIFRLYPDLGLRQCVWLLLGSGLLSIGLRYSPNLGILRRYKYLWLTIGLLLAGLTILFGTNPLGEGPRLWLGCCGIYFQPSEPLKLLLIIYVAAYLADNLSPIATKVLNRAAILSFLAPTLLLSSIIIGLLAVQRDLGTAVIFLFIYTMMIYVGTGEKRIPILSLLFLGMIGFTGYLLFDLVRLRVEAWLNPWTDPIGRSYQIVQSLIAIANGGLFGRGPGLGSPGLVPVAHSDFIFAAISEELGLLGSSGLLLLFALLGYLGLTTALNARQSFHRFLAAGLSAYFVGQGILIVAGNLRVLPLTGVTLPFVSYGGSSLITSFIGLLLLIQISRQAGSRPYPLTNRAPFLQLGALLFIGLLTLSAAAGWWGIIRSDDLLSRTDNLRRFVSDLYSRRGSILDRTNRVLTETTGVPGEYQRSYRYPPLGPVLGYTHPIYGQSGLEASMDTYLRGLQGSPQLRVWWSYLVYGQHPPGLDLRLSLDQRLQEISDQLLNGVKGALVLMDAENGEILVMSSHPNFDSNNLDETWAGLISDPDAPLLNRATLGSYQPGTALGPFWLTAFNASGESLPAAPSTTSLRLNGSFLTCAVPPVDRENWADLIASGCPAASEKLVEALSSLDAALPFQTTVNFGLYSSPELRIPVAAASELGEIEDLTAYAVGQSTLRVSPLQMSLAAAAITMNGVLPAPRFCLAVDTPQSGYVVLPPLGNQSQAAASFASENTASALTLADDAYWLTIARALNGEATINWVLAGTSPSWQGSHLSLALVIEEDNPNLAASIAETLLQSALGLAQEP